MESNVLFRRTVRNHVISTDFIDRPIGDCNAGSFSVFMIERSVVNCGSDMAKAMFEHFFSNFPEPQTLNPKSDDSRDWEKKGVLREFSQKEFLPDEHDIF